MHAPPHAAQRTAAPEGGLPLGTNLLLGLGYIAIVWVVSQGFAHVPPIWPASALAAFAALVGGPRWMPGIAIAAWLGHDLLMGWSTLAALWIALGTTLAPLLSAAILRRLTPDIDKLLDSANNVAFFCFFALMSSALGAGFVGLAAAAEFGARFEHEFTLRAVADLTAVLMLTPALLIWRKDFDTPCQFLRGNREMWLTTISLIALTVFLFFGPARDVSSLLRTLSFFIMLPLAWVALRFRQRGAFTLLALVYLLAVGGTWMGMGVLAELPMPLTRLHLIMMTMGVITLLASALSLERRRAMEALSASNALLEQRVNLRTQQLANNLKHLEVILDSLPVPMVITSPDKSIVLYANQAAATYSGYPLELLIGRNADEFFIDKDEREKLRQLIAMQGYVNAYETVLRHRDGHTLWVLLSAMSSRYRDVPVVIFGIQDISQAKQREQDLEQLVSTDTLTGVATRHHFMTRGEEILRQSERNGQPLTLLLLDLDRFKSINDTHGHAAGDQVLRGVAETFRGSLRPGDLCGRLGGEEFAIVLANTDRNAAERSAERLRHLVNALHIRLDSDNGGSINPSTSIGAIVYTPLPHDERPLPIRIETLIEQADQALYRAKAAGRNRVIFA